jgi:putative PIN family toxin of toxin-antitoxin system
MRVVLDTNILISALWKPDGLEAAIIQLAREGKIACCVSHELWEEYREVLSREKFANLSESAAQLLLDLSPQVTRVRPSKKVTWSGDDEDNRVLECLQESGAEYLITGNLRHFPAEWEGARIVNARTFFTIRATEAPP